MGRLLDVLLYSLEVVRASSLYLAKFGLVLFLLEEFRSSLAKIKVS